MFANGMAIIVVQKSAKFFFRRPEGKGLKRVCQKFRHTLFLYES